MEIAKKNPQNVQMSSYYFKKNPQSIANSVHRTVKANGFRYNL